MKKLLIFSIALLTIGCQKNKDQSIDEIIESNDVDALRQKQSRLQEQADSLQSLSVRLSERIADINPDAPKLVKYKVAKDSLYYHYVNLQANIETDQDVQVTPEFGGVLSLLVKEGEYVKKGQLIARISDGGLADQVNQAKIQVDQARAQLQQAEIQRDLAKITFEKQQSLWNKNIGSEIQYLQAKTNYETAQKQVSAARQQVSAAQRGVSGSESQLAKTRLKAPFSGRVEQVITQNGQAVGPGTPILRLVNPSNIKAVANVPENYLPKIKEGTKAIISLPALGKTIDSQVSLISASINPANRTFRVEVPVPDRDGMVKPNLNAELRLNDYTSSNAIIVQENVIHEDGDGTFVYVAENVQNDTATARKVHVEVGTPTNGIIEIRDGIRTGQVIITEAPSKLKEGDKIELIKAN
ncbi:efflux RND transporter periplasmic adaptor subunit [Flavobacteriaceae bacterium Ap0902]|nr:efflux RND transporter periplasmic adaptor subunit [Flavobacteriaceae bacterium Ap0902]